VKFFTFCYEGGDRPGVVLDDRLGLDLAAATHGDGLISSLIELIQAGDPAIKRVQSLISCAQSGEFRRAVFELAQAQFLAPIPRPRKNVFCVGRNYKAHVAEGARIRKIEFKLPDFPQFFTKPPTAVAPADGVFALNPRVTQKLDYEVELGVVIGRSGRNIAEHDAMNHVFGYTVIDDITGRDLQFRHDQWFKGKGLDGSCPMGPWIVHSSAVSDPHHLDIELRVNGQIRQKSNTSLMIFNLPRIISELSLGLTLESGDIIATGTPEGVGLAMEPPSFLAPGDVIECQIQSLGSQKTRIIQGSD